MLQNKPLLTIFLVVFIDLLGFGLILPLLPFIAERFQASPQQIGLLAASYSLFQFVSGPVLGRLSDRYGRKKLLVISQMGTFAGFVLLAFANSLPLLFLSRIIDGITGGNISIAQAYIADSTDQANRAKGMGMIGAAFGLGFIIGPTLGGVLSRGGYMLPALVAAGISFISMVVTTLFLKETVNKKAVTNPATGFNFTQLALTLKDKKLQEFTLIFFVLNLAFSSMQGIFALWAQVRFGWTAQSTGYLLGFVGLMSVICQLKILPFAIKKFPESTLLKMGIPLMAFGFLTMALAPNAPILYLTQIPLVLGNSFANPTLQALATEEVHPTEYGGVMGLFQSAGSMARIIGPAAGGFIFAAHPNLPYIIAATITIGSLLMIPRATKLTYTS